MLTVNGIGLTHEYTNLRAFFVPEHRGIMKLNMLTAKTSMPAIIVSGAIAAALPQAAQAAGQGPLLQHHDSPHRFQKGAAARGISAEEASLRCHRNQS